MTSLPLLIVRGVLLFTFPSAFCFGADVEYYRVREPEKAVHHVESAHFVAQWNDGDGVKLSDSELKQGLATLEATWDFYTGPVGFQKPYANENTKYKVSVNLSNKGWASGSGVGRNHPAMWLHFNAFKDKHALAHEFAHCLQFSSMGLRDSKFVGWSWESQAEWMTHQMYRDQVGCSEQLVNAPHLYYGSTRNRYGNWQFWEYIKDRFGYAAINDIWTKSARNGSPKQPTEDPIVVLTRNMGWTPSDLNDQFGEWAMHNVTWDYKNGEVYRKCYGSYDDRSGAKRNRVSLLEPLAGKNGTYTIPDYRAPQRFGYNLVRIVPEATGAQRSITIGFQGLVQTRPGVTKFAGNFEKEPSEVPDPSSDWRWGLVATDAEGRARYSKLQRGPAARLTFPLQPNEKEVWLVVTATPREYQRIEWDQMYYAIYRYPWTVKIEGGYPSGGEPAPDSEQTKVTGAAHPNGGGWVAATARVEPSAFVGPEAIVRDQAQVFGKARIEGRAVVSGNAQVRDNAIVRGRALVTGSALVAGKARVEQEATIYGGTIDEEARLGALTIVEGGKTHIHGKADIASVMNTIKDLDLSGTVRLIGDIELHTSLSKGVFYGMVTPDMVNNPRWGAERTGPSPELTSVTTGGR
ncbi:MAG: DUF6055 domain-containing protein [Verrucomicrobiota bacterium]